MPGGESDNLRFADHSPSERLIYKRFAVTEDVMPTELGTPNLGYRNRGR